MWVFGYGSLMWNPGFPYARAEQACLKGYRRSFCVYSHHHRGTPLSPGLVLGLDPGGECQGIVFEVQQGFEEAALSYLYEREMCGYAYQMMELAVLLSWGEETAYVFVADPSHRQYAGTLPVPVAARLIMEAEGVAGLNREYLINTIRQLESMGIVEPDLHALLKEIEHQTGLIEQGSGI